MRVRGLKRTQGPQLRFAAEVAPRAGAWVETYLLLYVTQDRIVAPRAGAWVETSDMWFMDYQTQVAPRAGAWVETARKR